MLGVWLIIVPMTGMVLLNWRLVMKPTLERKKRMRMNGAMRNEREQAT